MLEINRRIFLVGSVVPLLLLQGGCPAFSASDLTLALGVAQIAITGIVDGLQQAGKIPSGQATTITDWATKAAAAVAFASTELANSTDTTAQKIVSISNTFAPILASLDPAAQPYIGIAQADLNAFLKLLVPPGTATTNDGGLIVSHTVNGKSHVDDKVPARVNIGYFDRRKLSKIDAGAHEALARLASMKK